MADYNHLLSFRQFQEYLPPHNATFANPAFAGAPYRVLIARLSPFRSSSIAAASLAPTTPGGWFARSDAML